MAEYLGALPVHEAGLAALYLAGVPFPETDGRELNVGGALLSRVLAQLSGADQPTMHAAYLRYGDLGGAAEDLLQARGKDEYSSAAGGRRCLCRDCRRGEAGCQTANHEGPAGEGHPV